jgi:hypothetical protein
MVRTARGSIFKDGPSTACFPAGIALGATWNPALIEQAGVALGVEAKLKGARVLLAPTVNAVLQVWYPGQECGNAIADVLLGAADPGGRLPQTWPLGIEDTVAFGDARQYPWRQRPCGLCRGPVDRLSPP